MLDLETIKKLDNNKTAFFRFKKFGGNEYLLTNDVGMYAFLKEKDFKDFIQGKLKPKSLVYQKLKDNLFIKDDDYLPQMVAKYKDKSEYLKYGPSLYIIVVTLRCNHKCIYCHASAGNQADTKLDMDLATAKKVVDAIFKTPSKYIAIEFQGGEPVLNWPVVKFIIQFAQEKNKLEKKNLLMRLVSNFSLLDDEKIDFLIDNNVQFCTSLDGDEKVHNYNRIYSQGNSFAQTVSNIKKINNKYKEKFSGKKKNYFNVGAVITVSRKSLANHKSIIDTYLKLGYRVIYLRYLNPYGFAANARENIGYQAEEFIDFYKKTLDYILEKNYNGRFFADKTAVTYLAKILYGKDVNNLDMRSPCGAAIGQIAFNYNGDVYTCDEGRMLARMGDETFKLGSVFDNSFEQLVNNSLSKSICLSSCTSGLPGYEDNVFQPYLSICPVYNYSVYNNIFPACPTNMKFKIDEAIINYLFQKLQNKKNEDIFREWVKKVEPQIFR